MLTRNLPKGAQVRRIIEDFNWVKVGVIYTLAKDYKHVGDVSLEGSIPKDAKYSSSKFEEVTESILDWPKE